MVLHSPMHGGIKILVDVDNFHGFGHGLWGFEIEVEGTADDGIPLPPSGPLAIALVATGLLTPFHAVG